MSPSLGRLIPGALLGAALLAPAALPNDTVAEPWGRDCVLDWCDRPPPAARSSPLEAALADAAEAAVVGAGQGCVPPARWAVDQVPAAMVIRQHAEAGVRLKTWTYPVREGSTVLALCARPIRTPKR